MKKDSLIVSIVLIIISFAVTMLFAERSLAETIKLNPSVA